MSNPYIEQIEIIERTVEERRRPIPPEEALSYQPSTHIRTSTERFVTEGQLDTSQDPLERRFQQTGERDFSKDSSFLYQSGQIPLPQPPPPLQQSTPEKSGSQLGINNYGYHLHEIITDEGGARIVEMHGAGQPLSPGPFSDSSILAPHQNDHSLLLDTTMLGSHGRSPPRLVQHESSVRKLDYTTVTTPTTTRLKTIEPPVWSQYPLAAEAGDRLSSSLTRQASYKRMQESQAAEPYAPSSNATIISKGSSPVVAQHKWSNGKAKRRAGNLMSSLISQGQNAFDQLRQGKFTPRSVVGLLLLLLLFFFILFVLWQIFSALFFWDSVYTFNLYPPVCEDCLKRNPSAVANDRRAPSELSAHQSSSSQVHFELLGSPPFRSNSYTIVDFSTGFIAVADHAFVDESGRHTTCFIMQLDTSALPDMKTVMYAIRHSPHDVYTQFGWHEYWQFNPEPVDPSYVHGKFRDEVAECRSASHWYFLRPTVYTRDASCSDCYDFCLPDYAVQRRQKYEDEASIGIRRLNCFRLYVPEWSQFVVHSDELGGHWQYPHVQSRYTQPRNERLNAIDSETSTSPTSPSVKMQR